MQYDAQVMIITLSSRDLCRLGLKYEHLTHKEKFWECDLTERVLLMKDSEGTGF